MSLKTRALAGLGTAAVALSFAAPAVAVVDELPPSHDGPGETGFGSSGR